MLEDCENRNCNCCCSSNNQSPAVSTYSYEFTNIQNDNTCEEKQMQRDEMLDKIRALDFAVVDISEYLNTHPDDERAICLHKDYSKKLKDLKEKYQKVYGPLSIYFPCNKWRWLEEPWPWERGNF